MAAARIAREAKTDDEHWCNTIRQMPRESRRRPPAFPVPPCPPRDGEPWVVLATVAFSTNADPASDNPHKLVVRYADRRVLLSTRHLQVAVSCLP